MPVSPEQFSSLIQLVSQLQPMPAYQAAKELEMLKPEMTDAQRHAYEQALGEAQRQRKEIEKANAAATEDAFDQDED
ncbi:hypothetical protein HQN60_01365 [Deefgea piscis]|uniref:Uncharacterized protein n=1 Tax=Deefgea piscis TaxID=2739061 RepID=A0A6M8SK70_9NEIS|nr:hypothetical protein [Deefgea piscis]QKJ65492.1 hypothetical protein HQN60_01365 [Deefgea piscis]